MKCSVALERVRSDIGEDIPQLWRDRELYYYLEKGQQKLCNDVQIEEEMTAQVTAENRVGLPQTVVQVVEVLYKKLATDTLAKMRQVPITELEYATEWSVWDNYLYFGDVLTTCADGLIIRCMLTPSPILDSSGNLVSANNELGYCAGIAGAAYAGFPEKFAMGVVSFAVAQAKKRTGDLNGYSIEMGEFGDIKRIWDQRQHAAGGWIENTMYGGS
jgi:hypothetical protein